MERRRLPGAALAALIGLLLLTPARIPAAPKSDLWDFWSDHDPASTVQVDHTQWDTFLRTYVIADHPSAVNRVRYASVAPGDRRALQRYIAEMERVAVLSLSRAEQFAYWVNVYNAVTVELVLEAYPVESIREIRAGGLFATGPWDDPVFTVEGETVTLNDIEHRILRPIWNDRRIHFIVNCASIGCPNLWPRALTADNTEAALYESERAYLGHERGVTVRGGRVTASSIFDWYREDFARTEADLIAYWSEFAPDTVARDLRAAGDRPRIRYEYDWQLNEP